MKPTKPSSSSRASLLLIGQNSRENWVVRDQRGLRRKLSVDRAEALRFAMFENGNRPHAVVIGSRYFRTRYGSQAEHSASAVARYQRLNDGPPKPALYFMSGYSPATYPGRCQERIQESALHHHPGITHPHLGIITSATANAQMKLSLQNRMADVARWGGGGVLVGQIGYQQREQEHRGHKSDLERKAINAIHVSLP